MGRACAVIPQVFNKRGEVVDSKLFKDLLSFIPDNRDLVVEIYRKTKSADFIRDWNPRLVLDKNDEPTVRSMISRAGLGKYIDERRVLEKLNRDIGFYKRGMNRPALWIKNQENYAKLSAKARKFNTTSEFRDEYVARIIDIPDTESHRVFMGVKVERRTKLYSMEADQMEYNARLNERLRQILESHGVSIGVLNELERRLGVNGVTDFSMARTVAEGTVELIRLAEGIKGEKALPEEFAHFALEAIGSDNPFVKRLLNLIVSQNLAQEIIGDDYETYQKLYKGDEVKLAKEAAGKLLAKHLLQAEAVPNKPYKNLLQRLIASIKNFFSGLSASSIQKAMIEADKAFGNFAKDILNGSFDSDIDIANIKEVDKLYSTTEERIDRDKKLLRKIIDNELKRLKVYESRNSKSKFDEKQRQLIDSLELKLIENNEIEGIYEFVTNTFNVLKSLNSRLIALSSSSSVKEKAGVLRDIRNYLFSFKHIIKDTRSALLDEELHKDNRYGEGVRIELKNIEDLMADLYLKYTKVALPLFVDFIKPFLGEGLTVPFGKWKGKVISVETLVDLKDLKIMADEDISFFDRWLDSMADSSDYIIKILDQAVKKSKENARLRTIEDMKELQAAHIRLEQAGIRDTEWMFERDSQGNLTGRYIDEINWGLFKEARRALYKSLKEKYGNNPIGPDAVAFNKERVAWNEENMETVDGIRRPKVSLYGNEDFKRMHSEDASATDKAKLAYYNTVMKLKRRLDSYLPEDYTTLTNTVKIRKDLLERVKASDGVKSGAKAIWEDIKDQFIRRSDDIEIGDRATIKDFEEKEVQVLPIYYTKLRDGESNNDISTDVTSTMIAYAAMANDYSEMNKVIDVLEVSRDMLRDNLDIGKTRGDKPLVERFKSVGRTIESKVIKSKDSRRIMERIDDFFEMQVYGRYIADEGTFGNTNIDKAKVADYLNKVTVLNTLALNILSGISNVTTGKVMMRIESFAKEFFSEKDTIIADKNYAKEMPAFLAEIGSRVQTNKIALWNELFNVLQDYETEVRDTNFDRKNLFSRRCNSSALFLTNNAGEHWMQTRTSLALANRYEMKDPNGKIVSLWDAMEVVYIDPNNKKLGAKLQLKKGYTKKDGSEFTNDDIFKFSRKSAAINQRMHGIYNKLDRSAVQRLAIGRMAIIFRKWIKPSLNRRWKSATYNFDMEAWTEGYYRTSWRFFKQLAKELKEGQFAVMANWRNLTDQEKANVKRAATEVAHFLAVALVLALVDWDDDKERPWLKAMAEYQARRLYTELGSFVPGPQVLNEGLKIMKSPSADIYTMEKSLDLIKLLNPYNYETFVGEEALLKSGRFKGESRATKLFYESPIIPMNKTIYRGLHPEESLPFFKQ